MTQAEIAADVYEACRDLLNALYRNSWNGLDGMMSDPPRMRKRLSLAVTNRRKQLATSFPRQDTLGWTRVCCNVARDAE